MEIEEVIEERKMQKRPVWISLLLYFMLFIAFMVIYGLITDGILLLTVGKAYESKLLYYIGMESSMLLAVLTSVFIMTPTKKRMFSDIGFVFKGHIKDLFYGALLAFVLYVIGFGLSLIWEIVEVTGFQFDFWALVGSLFFLC